MSNNKFALSPKSVRFIIVGLIVMISGYILMIGGGSDDPNVFNPEMFKFGGISTSYPFGRCDNHYCNYEETKE